MSVLLVETNADFRTSVLAGVDVIRFADSDAPITAIFRGNQFDDVQILATASIFGGSGANTLKITDTTFFAAMTLQGLFDWQGVDRLIVSGTSGDDILIGSAANETLIGGRGNDRFRGEGGSDRLFGGDGDDTFVFVQKFHSIGNAVINGGAGFDTIIVNGDYHDFRELRISGIEALEFTNPSVSATFAGTQFGGPSGISQVKGGIFADHVVVTGKKVDLSKVTFSNWNSASDSITIRGDNAGSTLIGTMLGDKIEGGTGRDVLDFRSATGPVTGSLELGSISSLSTGTDQVSGIEVILGSSSGDSLTGDDLGNELYGRAGSDQLEGRAGADFLFGGAGSDRISGEAGEDFIAGGNGSDTLSGGIGNDVYYYASSTHGRDRILDFVSGADQFYFSAVGFSVASGYELENKITFISSSKPVVKTDSATVLYNSDLGRLYFDVDGTGAAAAVLIATIEGAPIVRADDIVFI